MQAQYSQNTTGWKLAKEIISKEGFLSLYRGFTASVFGISHVAVYFPLYDMCKDRFAHDKEPQLLQVLSCSLIPKIIASAVSYPHEVMRSRLFTHDKSYDKRFNGLHGLILYTYKTEGIKGFYGGFIANLWRILPSTIITLYTYEKVKYYLEHV